MLLPSFGRQSGAVSRALAHIGRLLIALVLLVPATAYPRAAKETPLGAALLIKYEQDHVNRSVDDEKIFVLQNNQSDEFTPEKANIFPVKSYWIDADKFHQFSIPEDLRRSGLVMNRQSGGKAQSLMIVHPESEDYFSQLTKGAPAGPSFSATSTASSRTLMMWPDNQPANVFFGKLSLAKEIGGVFRTIPRGEVARSLGIAMILRAAHADLPANFEFLPEFFGSMPKDMERGGLILRSLPTKYVQGPLHLMPLFALYTSPNKQTASPIRRMISESGRPAQAFVRDTIVRPFIQQWFDLAIHSGIAIETHAQNVLVEVNGQGRLTGTFAYRDFGGFNVDLAYRRARGLAMPADLPVIDGENVDYHQKFHRTALRKSLEIYFEGGFLFGLAESLTAAGYKNVSYADLGELMRGELTAEGRARGIKMPDEFSFTALVRGVYKARKNPAPPCQRVLVN